MNLTRILPFAALLAATLPTTAQNRLADLLSEPGVNLDDPASRQRIVDRLKVATEQRRQDARVKAQQRGLPLRVTRANGATQEIADFDGERPIYFTTHNVNAAISTGANLVRSTYTVEGTGITVGIWDGGWTRATHQEFGSRVVVKDSGSSYDDHATHVGGTIAASGVVANAKGMAPLASIDSYDWNSDVAEMTARGATAPSQATRIYLSNHSYGYISGWNYIGSANRMWEWYGNGTTSTGFDQDFGRYNTYSRDQDALAYSAPYYLIFRSAGNDRTDNPVTGEQVGLSPGAPTTVAFDPASHPAGDGQFRGGFECMGFDALAKNVITVGSAADAVTGGLRDATKANVSSFSSWGPTDDGRIKPDVVANGEGLYSSLAGSNSSYGTYSGTSMATPNATGSSALLIQHYGNLFPGQAMRSSTLKGLLIHTADDRGNAGPDYKYGWGMINAKAAADLISDHLAHPEKQRLAENQLTTSTVLRTHSFVWDGSSPIRATLCWTDPAGTATTTSDLRSPRLVNDLNLKLIAPGGAEYFPYVMPFVGTWTLASMNSLATTGVNNTDNTEQVYLPSPALSGTWQAVVSYSGALTNGSQNYSLLLNGAAAVVPPPPPLSVASISPSSGLPGTITVDLTGTGFEAGTAVKLTRAGQTDIQATGEQLIGESLRCQLNLTGAAAGAWNVVATNPDLETVTLTNGFTVIGALWAESFDGTVSGWTSQATTGSNAWSVVTTASHSPTKSYFAPAPATKSTVELVSPSIAIPANASNLQLSFWHSYDLQTARDGGKLDFSIDGGAWFDVTSASSGLTFASNGYNTNIGGSGKPSDRSEFENGNQPAWSGNSNGFINTLVNFTDNAKFAGKSLRMRWRLATDTGTSSPGWYVDTISLIGGGNITNQAPAITTAASSSSVETVTDPDTTVFQILRGTGSTFTVAGSDDGGEPALTYTWSSTGPAPVFFQTNGNNAAKTSIGTFEATGDYLVSVAVRDSQNLTTTSTVNIRVVQTAADVRVTPATASVPVGNTQSFGASLLDQFGQPMASQPSSFAWSASGGGAINSSGLFSATTAGGPYVVNASASGYSNTASVTVLPLAASVTLQNLSQTYNGSPRPVTAQTTPAGLSVAFTYGGSATAPTNVGSYAVIATVTDPNYQGTASGTLVIGKATAGITLSSLSPTYDGTPKAASATTSPAGLNVSFTYNGSATVPTAAGSYTVVATVNDTNYQGTANGTLVIGKAAATVTLGSLAPTYDGTPKAATATTTPGGLNVGFTYDGSASAPANAGSYTVVATVNDTNYQGTANGALIIGKASATITLGSLAPTYDGSPKNASATTSPAGLSVSFTYEGSGSSPVNAGSYAVAASISDTNYQGTASGTLVIGKATATVTLGDLVHDYDGTPKAATATTDPAGLTVAFTYNGSTTAPSAIGTYAVVATVNDANYQGSANGTLEINGMIYGLWETQQFSSAQILGGETDPEDDPDHDGLENLAEYALGSDPNSFTAAPAFTLDATHLTLTFTRPKGRNDVGYHAETSDQLGGWIDAPLEVTGETETHETVRARVARPAGNTPLFLRLRFD
jgi:hypothetical protein